MVGRKAAYSVEKRVDKMVAPSADKLVE